MIERHERTSWHLQNPARKQLRLTPRRVGSDNDGRVPARLFDKLLKGNARIRKPALKRARAHAEFLRDILQRWTSPGL